MIWLAAEELEIAVAEGGGHITALPCGDIHEVNPYWLPPWPLLELSDLPPEIVNEQYGALPEGGLLASILGHTLALGLDGLPSQAEAAAGAGTHGQVEVQPWRSYGSDHRRITGECHDSVGELRFSRSLEVIGSCVVIEDTIQNLCDWDRPICCQQHVSFGAPFCEDGFSASANSDCGTTHPQCSGVGSSLLPNVETHWPLARRKDGQVCDYREPIRGDLQANDFSGYRMRPSDQLGNFIAGNRRLKFALFCIWPRHFFPWPGIWDERRARANKPWCRNVSVRAFEFSVSPYPDTRRNLLGRALLFDIPTVLVLPAGENLWVRYIMGVFLEITDPADVSVSGLTATLPNARARSAALSWRRPARARAGRKWADENF